MGIPNPTVKDHIDSLFGEDRAENLRPKLNGLTSNEKELTIVEELCQAVKSYGNRYTLPFRFKDAKGKRTSHHLIFVSKNRLGYDLMKDIMARESTASDQGIASFEYNPADFLPKQSLLFQLDKPFDELKDRLLEEYDGRTISMENIYLEHSVDTPYVKKNYKDALIALENDRLITAKKPNGKNRRRETFADDVMAIFPKRLD